MSESEKVYTVRWPKSATHDTKSVSGVLVETNVQGQIALHLFNEVRELEAEVQYRDDGSRIGDPRPAIYVREIAQTVLLPDSAARHLGRVLNALYEESPADDLH